MPWVENLTDLQELRRCIRDLVALSTLSAIWTGYGPQQIGDSVAAALVSMLNADFVYAFFPGERGQSPIEVVHPGKGITVNSLGGIRAALRRGLSQSSEQAAVIANPTGDGNMRVASTPIGFGGEAALIAGSGRQPDFPTAVQRCIAALAGRGQRAVFCFADRALIGFHRFRRPGRQATVCEPGRTCARWSLATRSRCSRPRFSRSRGSRPCP